MEKKKPAAKVKKVARSNCESCEYYEYDEDYDCYSCQLNLDEDEMERFATYAQDACPYYRFYDEYALVRKQN